MTKEPQEKKKKKEEVYNFEKLKELIIDSLSDSFCDMQPYKEMEFYDPFFTSGFAVSAEGNKTFNLVLNFRFCGRSPSEGE